MVTASVCNCECICIRSIIQTPTRQSEMTNTSPPPQASAWQRSPHYNRKFWYFFVTSFLCSLELLYVQLTGLPKRFPWKIFERNCRSSVYKIYAIELLGAMSTDEAWRHIPYVVFVSGVHWPTGSLYAKVCNDSLNITIFIGSQRS